MESNSWLKEMQQAERSWEDPEFEEEDGKFVGARCCQLCKRARLEKKTSPCLNCIIYKLTGHFCLPAEKRGIRSEIALERLQRRIRGWILYLAE